jgi:hypothetical protein
MPLDAFSCAKIEYGEEKSQSENREDGDENCISLDVGRIPNECMSGEIFRMEQAKCQCLCSVQVDFHNSQVVTVASRVWRDRDFFK